MTDIIDRLKEPEAHYPGNFDTPKRANAMLSCLCQEAMEEIESLRQQLAEKDAEIERLSDEIGYQSQWKTEFRQQKEYAEKQLADSLAREQQLREWIEANSFHDDICNILYLDDEGKHGECSCGLIEAIALPQDTAALESMIAKAGEVMRERAISKMTDIAPWEHRMDKIRAITTVTIDDLK